MAQEDNEILQNIVDIIFDHFVCQRKVPQFTDFSEENGELIQIPISNPKKQNPEYIAAAIVKSESPREGNPIVLFCPGGCETIDDYFSFYNYFYPNGISFCVMDYRCRGYSEGDNKSYGPNETNDVFAVIDHLKNMGYHKISLFGRSIGASCCVCAAEHYPDLVCIALDSPRIYFTENITKRISRYGHISIEKVTQLLPQAYQIVFDKSGADLSKYIDPYKLADKITQPIYVIHGTNDSNVPCKNSKDLIDFVNSQDKKLELFNGNHISYRFGYFQKMIDFILRHNGVENNQV